MCVTARIDVDTHEIAYVNAGHPSGLVLEYCGDGARQLRLASTGPPAGLFPHQHYQTSSLRLPRGAVTILVTDGITEAFDELHLSETEPIASLVAELPDPRTPDRICDLLITRTTPALSSDGSGWQDDRTVVAFALSD